MSNTDLYLRTSRHNGVGGVVSHCPMVVVTEVVRVFVIVGVGFKGQYLDYAQPPWPNMGAQTLPHLCFILCMFCCDLRLLL